MEYIIMDGVTYRVRAVYKSRQRSFSVLEGPNSGEAVSGRRIRDVKGTGYAYSMQVEPDPAHPEDYDLFFEAISAPVAVHEVTLPYAQGTMTFDAAVSGGTDTDCGVIGGRRRYTGLTVQFDWVEPQRTP